MKKHRNESIEELYRILTDLETVEECEAFLDDICTIRELQDLSQRWQVAKLLHEGKNYQEISGLTGASTATICRVNKCLMYGSGGYLSALKKTENSETKA